ncbi:T9SS type A sorting domain-containing protein [Fibrella sp. HMF5335]|uniref:T9SS type A sorting domain-containing protein n=1 Tax=Fibrella rubiginis TaxID=2817060 RepID=A0A939GMJ7_9BACT|nr:T9SS type A sorting domain-containing protein [Fibrella rubiginis]MBO0939546.1 T9SS type A sorting domain-containing protein [Fibrella rubiginis]
MKNRILFWLLISMACAANAQAQKRPYQLLMTDPNVRYVDVKKAFEKEHAAEEKAQEKAIRRALRKGLPEPEFEENEDEAKFYRWEQWMLRHLGPDGRFDPAREPQELARFAKSQPVAQAVQPANARRANPRWKELGPFLTQTTATGNNSNYLYGYNVGRLGAVAFHPTDANTIYTIATGRGGSNAGGIWRTTDAGQTWTPLFDEGKNMVLTDIAVSSKNPQTIYATGNYFGTSTNDVGASGYGVFKSTNGGANWAFTSFKLQYETNATGSKAGVPRATNIIIDPVDDQHLIALCSRAIMYSTDGGQVWQKSVSSTVDRLADYWDVEFKPNDPSVVYVGGSGKDQVLRSTDGGRTFTQLVLPDAVEVGTVGRVELAVSAAAPDFLYLLTTMGTERHGGLYRLNTATNDLRVMVARGKNFATSQQTRDDTQLYYCLTMNVSPADTNEIHVGMVPLMSSHDGGKSWEYRHGWATNRTGDVHSDVSSIEFQPGTNRLFVTSDGGLSGATGKKGAAFRFYNNIAVSQIYFVAQSASMSDRMVIGLQDNGTKLFNGTEWQQVGGGDGISCLIDDTNPNVFYVTSQNGYLLRTANGLQNYITPSGVTADNTSFFSPLDYHQATKTLFLGSNSLWRKDESSYSSTWEKVYTFDDKEIIQDVWVAPSDVKTMYVRTYQFKNSVNNYRVYASTDGGANWEKLLGDGFDGYVTALVIHPADAKTLWACRYDVTDFYYYIMKSADGGHTWTKVNANLPRLASNAMAYQEGTDDGLYVALDQGVYYKDNGMSQWIRHGTALPNAPVYDLRLDYTGGKVKAATQGRGVWEADLAVPVGQVSALATNRTEVCAGATVGISFQISKGTSGANNYSVQLSDAVGSFAAPQTLTTVTATAASVTIPASQSAGKGYLIRVLRNNNIATADTSAAFSVLTLPVAQLNGPAEVVFGQPASLTIAFGGSGPWAYSLNGDSLRTATTSPVVRSVALTKGTSYSLTSLSNVCGNGTATGSVRVVVIPTLAISGFTTSAVCAGQTGSLSAVQGGSFNGSTGYVVQLSDATGNFSAPLTVGTGSQSPLSFSIAETQSAGSGYRLRLVGNTAERVETTPGSAFAINVKPTATLAAVGDSSILQTSTARLRLTFTGTAPFQYTLTNGTSGTASATTDELTVKPDQTTTYAIATVANGCGIGTVSGKQTITVIPLLAVDPSKGPVVTLLPNPASETVRVETSLTGPHDVILYDVLGRERLRRPFQQQADVSLQSLTKGLYVYRIITPKGAVEGRLLVE